MTKPKWTDRRDELAKEYGLKVAKHSWERGPTRNIDGTYREFSNRPDIFTESAFRFGFNAARADMQAEVEVLVKALENLLKHARPYNEPQAVLAVMRTPGESLRIAAAEADQREADIWNARNLVAQYRKNSEGG